MIISDIAFYRFAASQSGFLISVQKIKKIVERGLTNVRLCDKILSVITAQQNPMKPGVKKLKKF